MRHASSFIAGFVTFTFGLFVLNNGITLAGHVEIQLKPEATVHSSQVRLQDVATLVGDRVDTAKLGAIEVHLMSQEGESDSFDAHKVNIRLILAGLSYDDFTLSGSNECSVTVKPPDRLTDTDVERQSLVTMAQMMGVDEKDVTVRLQNAFIQTLPPEIRNGDGLKLIVVPPRKGLGVVQVQIQIWQDEKIITTRPATLEVRKRHRVAVAKVSLTRDMPLDEYTVQFENRFLPAEMDELDVTQVIGQQVKSSVSAGSVLQMRDIQAAKKSARTMVARGELVRVYAVAGRLETVFRNAEAMQNGNLGEFIKLKNRDSGQEIVGQVVSPGAVRIKIR